MTARIKALEAALQALAAAERAVAEAVIAVREMLREARRHRRCPAYGALKPGEKAGCDSE